MTYDSTTEARLRDAARENEKGTASDRAFAADLADMLEENKRLRGEVERVTAERVQWQRTASETEWNMDRDARLMLTAAALQGLCAKYGDNMYDDAMARTAVAKANATLVALKEHGSREPLASIGDNSGVDSAAPSTSPSPGTEDAQARHSSPAGDGARWIPVADYSVACSRCGVPIWTNRPPPVVQADRAAHERACWHAATTKPHVHLSDGDCDCYYKPAPAKAEPDDGRVILNCGRCGNTIECFNHRRAAPGEDAMVKELVEAYGALPRTVRHDLIDDLDPDDYHEGPEHRFCSALKALYAAHAKAVTT